MNGYESRHGDRVRLGPLIIVGLFIVFIYCALRVYGNATAYGSPPASCQLLGGHWGIWSGWSCGQ